MTLLVNFVLDKLVILPDWYTAPEHMPEKLDFWKSGQNTPIE
jgi:hypothetical protein